MESAGSLSSFEKALCSEPCFLPGFGDGDEGWDALTQGLTWWRRDKDGPLKLSRKGQIRKTSHEGLPPQSCPLGRGQGALVLLLKFAPMSASHLPGHVSLVGKHQLKQATFTAGLL